MSALFDKKFRQVCIMKYKIMTCILVKKASVFGFPNMEASFTIASLLCEIKNIFS